MIVLYSIIALGSIGIIAGIILVAAYGKLKVQEDPKVEEVVEALPGSNCGACGFASCHEYAISVSKGEAAIDLCRVGGAALSQSLAKIMGVDHADGGSVPQKAVVKCGVKERKYLAEYDGPQTCGSAQLLGGGLACKYGCFGYGDCVTVCPFDAIHLNENNVPAVDLEKCTACGLCVKACPRNIIFLDSLADDHERIVYVGCNNKQPGKDTRKVCAVGCIACKICEKKAPEGIFLVEEYLSTTVKQSHDIDIETIKCPTKCIYEARK
jgi:Na+-translocating ferredoxin:NAD+ oxidoreductase RNF subunit RnfB